MFMLQEYCNLKQIWKQNSFVKIFTRGAKNDSFRKVLLFSTLKYQLEKKRRNLNFSLSKIILVIITFEVLSDLVLMLFLKLSEKNKNHYYFFQNCIPGGRGY